MNHMEYLDKEHKDKINHPNGWISVDDRLPEDGQEILIYTPNSTIGSKVLSDRVIGMEHFDYGYTAKITENDYILSSNDFFSLDDPATHWQPLPEPPEEK